MPMRIIRSIRLRMMLSYMLIFGLIQTAACILVIWQSEKQTINKFDSCLEDQARTMAEVIEIAADGTLSRYDNAEIRRYARAFGCTEYHFEIRHSDGSLLESSERTSNADMGKYLPPTSELREKQMVMRDVHGESADEWPGRDESMRLLSYYHVPKEGNPFIVQVAMNLRSLEGLNYGLRSNFLRVSILALLAAGLTSWLLSRNAMRSIQKVEETVATIQPDSLGKRLDVDESADELVELTSTVNDLLARVEKAFDAQSDFLSHAAHELKTPLAALLSESQRLLMKEREKSDYTDHLSYALSEYRRLAKTIDSLLMLARAHAGLRDLSLQPISANDLAMTTVQHSQSLARQRQIRLVTQLAFDEANDIEPILLGTEELLLAMIENLLRNAIRLSPVGSSVEVAVSLDGENVKIAVRDEGPGIPEEQRESLFDAFVSKPINGQSSGGSGIGLTIARGVARLHGGDIAVENRQPVGAEFTIKLPRHDESESNDDQDTA